MNIILSLSARVKNKKTLVKPLLVDINSNNVVLGVFGTFTDDNGTFNGIELHVSEKGKFAPITSYIVEESTFEIPSEFETIEEVTAIDLIDLRSPKKVLVNPENVVRKVYEPVLNKTNVYVYNGTFDDKILTVSGDITESGSAYYEEHSSYGV